MLVLSKVSDAGGAPEGPDAARSHPSRAPSPDHTSHWGNTSRDKAAVSPSTAAVGLLNPQLGA